MAVCDWCRQEMLDRSVLSCVGNAEVEFPGGEKKPAVPFAAPLPMTEDEWLAMWRKSQADYKRVFPDAEDDPEDEARQRMASYLASQDRCQDCGVKDGGFHHPGCHNERCPTCAGQLIGCGCLSDGEDDEDQTMPLDWKAPDLHLRHDGVSVYKAYKNDRYTEPLTYSFRFDELEQDDTFDVRELKAWDDPSVQVLPTERGRIDAALRLAIERGEIKDPVVSHSDTLE